MPCCCQNQVDASILGSLNRQQAKNDKGLLGFGLLAKNISAKHYPNTRRLKSEFHSTPVPPNTVPGMKSPASKPCGLRDKNVEENQL